VEIYFEIFYFCNFTNLLTNMIHMPTNIITRVTLSIKKHVLYL